MQRIDLLCYVVISIFHIFHYHHPAIRYLIYIADVSAPTKITSFQFNNNSIKIWYAYLFQNETTELLLLLVLLLLSLVVVFFFWQYLGGNNATLLHLHIHSQQHHHTLDARMFTEEILSFAYFKRCRRFHIHGLLLFPHRSQSILLSD